MLVSKARAIAACALFAASIGAIGATPGCLLHSSSHVERGEAFTTGNPKYDDFFKEVVSISTTAKKAEDEEVEGRADLIAALGLAPRSDLALAVGETRDRAHKLKAFGILMHLELTPDVKLLTTKSRTADEVPPALVQGISESTRKSLDLARRLDEIAYRAVDLEKARVQLKNDAAGVFRGLTQVQRDEISHELDSSADVLVSVGDESKRHAGRASEFVVGIVTAVETGAAGPNYNTPIPAASPNAAAAVASARAMPTKKITKAPPHYTPGAGAAAKPPPATPPPAVKKKPKGGDDFDP